jgi:hypothetical protein
MTHQSNEELASNQLSKELDNVFYEQSQLTKVSSNPLTKAIIGTIPFSGGVASLLGDNAQKRQELRLRKFLNQVAIVVENMHTDLVSKVDKEYLMSDDFCAVVETLLLEVSRTADITKLKFLKAFFIASALKDRPDVTWKELYLNYIKQLSGFHLVILSIFFKIQGSLSTSDRMRGIEIPGQVPILVTDIKSQLNTVDSLLIEISCNDLNNLGLIIDWKYIRSENINVQEKYCLSDSGLRFFNFIKLGQELK